LNLPFFIARRIAFSGENNFSRVIIRIAQSAVALSVAVMIAATAFIAGFKHEISRKIFEFWGHIHISDTAYSLSFEPMPVEKNQEFYPSLDTLRGVWYTEDETILGYETGREAERKTHGGVRHIQAFAHKPGIIRTKTAMEGIILKGVGQDFDWNNLRPYLLEGDTIALGDTVSRDIIISRQTADRLQVGVGDRFIVHFVKEGEQLRRRFQICGIYKTGLEEYDRKFAICDIRQTQELLGWTESQVAGFEVWLDDLRDLDVYNDYIYTEVLPPELLCTSIRSKFPAIFEWLSLQDLNEVVIIGLMLAVAIINMITAPRTGAGAHDDDWRAKSPRRAKSPHSPDFPLLRRRHHFDGDVLGQFDWTRFLFFAGQIPLHQTQRSRLLSLLRARKNQLVSRRGGKYRHACRHFVVPRFAFIFGVENRAGEGDTIQVKGSK